MATFGIEGLPGDGKSSWLALIGWEAKKRGRRVYGNSPYIDQRTRPDGRPVDPKTFGRSWVDGHVSTIGDLCKLRNGIVLIDEADQWFGSVDWQKVTHAQRSFWTQHRKNGLDLYWCCTDFDRMMNVIRDITARCYTVTGYASGLTVVREWFPRDSKRDRARASVVRAFRGGPWIWDLYDTAFIVGDGQDQGGEEGRRAATRGEAVAYATTKLRAWPRGVEQVGVSLLRITDPDGLVRYERFDPSKRHPLELETDGGRVLDTTDMAPTAPPPLERPKLTVAQRVAFGW